MSETEYPGLNDGPFPLVSGVCPNCPPDILQERNIEDGYMVVSCRSCEYERRMPVVDYEENKGYIIKRSKYEESGVLD